MSDRPVKNVTRQELQNCAHAVEALNDAAQALLSDGGDDDAWTILTMMDSRLSWLGRALDSVNAPEVGQ